MSVNKQLLLLIDPEEYNLFVLQANLRRNYELKQFPSVDKAEDHISISNKPNAVIVANELKGSADFVKTSRKHGIGVVVVNSERNEPKFSDKAVIILNKPFNSDELQQAVSTAIENAQKAKKELVQEYARKSGDSGIVR